MAAVGAPGRGPAAALFAAAARGMETYRVLLPLLSLLLLPLLPLLPFLSLLLLGHELFAEQRKVAFQGLES